MNHFIYNLIVFLLKILWCTAAVVLVHRIKLLSKIFGVENTIMNNLEKINNEKVLEKL